MMIFKANQARILLAVITLTSATLCAAADLAKYRARSNSDDAKSIEEAFSHGSARALVIRNIQPNKLGVGGAEFRVKRNPTGRGCFVYDPRTTFSGVQRNLVWWVPEEGKAYALNSPSKMVTPSLKWPREDGFYEPSTADIVSYVFHNKPLAPLKLSPKPSQSKADSFTVKEYRLYRAVIGAPMSVPEAQAIQNAAKRYGVTTTEAKKAVSKVQTILFKNDWLGGSPESEIKHASDWKGERQ